MATRGGIPVRGRCASGHVVETVSDPGRVTWKGPCPTAGCVHNVIARRVGRPAPAAGDRVIDLTVPRDVALPSGRKIRKVTAYRDDTRPAGFADDQPDRGGGGGGADGEPAGVPAQLVDEPPPDEPDPPAGEPPAEPGRRPRRFGILSRAERDAGADVVPGIYP